MSKMRMGDVEEILVLLVKHMTLERLKLQNTKGNTFLHLGATRGNLKAVQVVCSEVLKNHGKEAWMRRIGDRAHGARSMGPRSMNMGPQSQGQGPMGPWGQVQGHMGAMGPWGQVHGARISDMPCSG
jgi:hypothetical protein